MCSHYKEGTDSCHVWIINPGFDVERTDRIDDNNSVRVNAGNCIDEVVTIRPGGQIFAVPSLQWEVMVMLFNPPI